MATANNAAPTSYFNLHTQGIGYLNRIREVPVRRGQPFMACDIAALHGASDDVEYTRFDCKVAGGEAERLIREHLEDVKADRKVLLAFRIGDLWVDAFTYEKGERKGLPGASLKGRLIFIEWIKVDGQLTYKAAPRAEAPASVEPEQQADEADAEQEAPADTSRAVTGRRQAPAANSRRTSTPARQSA
ncbi:STY4534 family ICE replication protein [Pseudomonas sp. App30]|uniref:STY4534 family ICE replication protein n=1 Tax=Pseudomonas sp. App30 TaxID=3068990 RepID=UPI003A8082F9